MGQYWLGKTKPKQVFRSTQNAFKKLPQSLKIYIYLMEFSTDWPTDRPTDWSTNWCLQTSITQRLRAWFFYCSMSLQPKRCLLAYHSTSNTFFRDLPESSIVFHSSLLTVNSISLVVAHDGFLCVTEIIPSKSSIFFIVATLITEMLFKQLLIRIAV